MNARLLVIRVGLCALPALAALPAPAQLANRVFVSARNGNNANACDNVSTPCQTFAGAVPKLNAGGEVIVLDSGGYGPVTITQSVTIEAPPGVLAFIHPPSGHAITVNASGSTVTLRGLVLNVGAANGIEVAAVGTLNVDNCFITGFNNGIHMGVGGNLNIKHTDVKGCGSGVLLDSSTGTANVSIDRCHLDSNGWGLYANSVSPGGSTTTATNTTANGNARDGWRFDYYCSGAILNLEFCTGSQNAGSGAFNASPAASNVMRLSNCVFANNGYFGIEINNPGPVQSRGNNTVTGNGAGASRGSIGSFLPM